MDLGNPQQAPEGEVNPEDEYLKINEQIETLQLQIEELEDRRMALLEKYSGLRSMAINDFLGETGVESHGAPQALSKEERICRAADPNYWSPKLKALIRRTKRRREFRKRLGLKLQGPTVMLGEGLSSEEIRYFVEDMDLEYET